jgi:hypothetical protein
MVALAGAGRKDPAKVARSTAAKDEVRIEYSRGPSSILGASCHVPSKEQRPELVNEM